DGPGSRLDDRRPDVHAGRRVLRAIGANPALLGHLPLRRGLVALAHLVVFGHEPVPSSTISPSTTSPSPDDSDSADPVPGAPASPGPPAPACPCCCWCMAVPMRWNTCIRASLLVLMSSVFSPFRASRTSSIPLFAASLSSPEILSGFSARNFSTVYATLSAAFRASAASRRLWSSAA